MREKNVEMYRECETRKNVEMYRAGGNTNRNVEMYSASIDRKNGRKLSCLSPNHSPTKTNLTPFCQ